MARTKVRGDLRIEQVDDELIVLGPSGGTVYVLRATRLPVRRRQDRGTPGRADPPLAGLVELGLVTTDAWDRRRVLLAGGAAVVAAAAVSQLALPSAACGCRKLSRAS